RNEYLWTVKDTTSTGVFKMETSFGSFLSKQFIISPVTRLSVDFVCEDSFQLSWNKHLYADMYNIYALANSPYLEKVLAVQDTFVVLKRSRYPEVVYAVQPLLRNNVAAARSAAINIEQQNVQCFFKTLYYNLLSQNVLQLVLEVGGVSYIDRIYFERVTQAGKVLQTYDGIKPTNSTIYNQSITSVPFGTSYWRAKIKLKSGEVVYSYIISVLTSGSRYIIFYPSPSPRNITLQYTLQQDVPTDCRLQIFDIMGRMIKSYSELPSSIDLRSFGPGVYIYKLFTADEQLLETGKLVLQ
ncbi:MAG TPA: T9SS type A sorting domain-containing protein, partial [Parafilimonas sp.]|nr:T9SS type A sorting domain-containing protein [Parafilimonas sp.]